MSKGKLEAFKSLKFDLKGNQVVGGYLPTTYGDYYNTTNGRKDPYGNMDTARMTYNAQNMQQPNSGQDDVSYTG